MTYYYITFFEGVGYCVVFSGDSSIVFVGTIAECNWKCIEFNEKRREKNDE